MFIHDLQSAAKQLFDSDREKDGKDAGDKKDATYGLRTDLYAKKALQVQYIVLLMVV